MEEFGSIPEPAFVAVQSTAIAGLIAKLETANYGSRELDGAVALSVMPGVKLGAGWMLHWPLASQPLQPYSTSAEAALSLVLWNRPGWGYDITYRAAWGNHTACVIGPERASKPHTAAGATAALALCAALLRATEAGA